METGLRLLRIYDRLCELIREFSPSEAGIENLFFAKNITSALPVAQARGAVFLLLAQKSLPFVDYPPQMIKRAVVGNGRAEKSQVQEMVKFLLGLKEIPKPDHAADALAAAICHAHSRGISMLQKKAASSGTSKRRRT
jgi:crossover junction endodeoxyribonuclease RuvC